jgi:cytochrome o ubiquinol oxidase subunit IV
MKASAKRIFISYTLGLLLSVLLTLATYAVVRSEVTGGVLLSIVLGILAISQAIVQLFFFLHITHENRPRWNLYALLAFLIILIIMVTGSIWVMNAMNYHMMPSAEEMKQFMREQNKKGF